MIFIECCAFDKPIETKKYVIGVEGKNKGSYFQMRISKYDNIREIEFYDDSQGNIDDMIQKKNSESVDREINLIYIWLAQWLNYEY